MTGIRPLKPDMRAPFAAAKIRNPKLPKRRFLCPAAHRAGAALALPREIHV